MSRRYIDLMIRALSAYSQQHINRYFNSVKSEGLSEHGFPRLTSNIGILISHGFRKDLTEIFIEMMDFCCDNIPKRRAANDFSIREIIACIREVESSGVIDSFVVDRWKRSLSTIEPLKCYYGAEEYHQKYLDKNPNGYCHIDGCFFHLNKN